MEVKYLGDVYVSIPETNVCTNCAFVNFGCHDFTRATQVWCAVQKVIWVKKQEKIKIDENSLEQIVNLCVEFLHGNLQSREKIAEEVLLHVKSKILKDENDEK